MDNIPVFEDESSKPQPGASTVERNTVNVVLRDPSADKYAVLNWPEFGWHTFIIGGIEADETTEDAARREIKEETGYKDVVFVKDLGKLRSIYFAAHKGENRIANTTCLLFDLVSDEREETSEEETKHHKWTWLSKEEVEPFLNLASQKYIWEQVQL